MDFSELGSTGSNILLIGEATKHRAQMNRFLLQRNHVVHSATNIEEALSFIHRKPPDLILIDLPAHDPSTRSFHTRLKSAHDSNTIPLIFISRCNAHEERHQLFASGASDYICTPIIADELHIRVASHLALRDLRPGSCRFSPVIKKDAVPIDTRTAAKPIRPKPGSPARGMRAWTDKESQDSQRQMRDLVAHAHTAIEKERKRIAQNIHDELGSLLTAMKLELALFNREIREIPDEPQQHLDSMKHLIEDAILVTRQIASDLRPVVLNLGLLAAIEWLAENFRRHSGITCQVIANDEIPLNDAQSTTLFRIIQESLTNITRHAEASVATINLKMKNGTLWLMITDNGRGFDTKEIAKNSFGLLGIRERLETLAGKLHIESTPGCGTTLSISMPIKNNTP